MKGRMALAAPPIRKCHVGGRSRRNAGFCRWKRSVSASSHSGLAAPDYDFALGIGDELVSYTVKKPRKSAVRYYAHANHLYSVATVTSSTGSVVERWSYNAYGVPTIKNSANATIAKSAVGNDRGFTGYKLDSETGLYAARARMYSAKLGMFISRDSYKAKKNGVKGAVNARGYHDGWSLYRAYFVPGKLDPTGNACSGVFGDPCGKDICVNGKTTCVPDEAKYARDTAAYATCVEDAKNAYEEALEQIDTAFNATESAINSSYESCNNVCESNCNYDSYFLRKVCLYTCKADCSAAFEPLLASAYGAWIAARAGATTTYGVMIVNCKDKYRCRR